jgi:hypothetical protein
VGSTGVHLRIDGDLNRMPRQHDVIERWAPRTIHAAACERCCAALQDRSFNGRDGSIASLQVRLLSELSGIRRDEHGRSRDSRHLLESPQDPLLPKRRVFVISLLFQCASVLVGFVSFTLSSLQPALHSPSVVDVLSGDNLDGSYCARKFDHALGTGKFFLHLVARPLPCRVRHRRARRSSVLPSHSHSHRDHVPSGLRDDVIGGSGPCRDGACCQMPK